MFNFFKKKNTLLYFSISILILNILFLLYGITTNSLLSARFMGGLAAIMTDPIILILGLVGGVFLQNVKFPVISVTVASILAAIVIHFILGTTRFIVDVIRVDALLLICSAITLITNITPIAKGLYSLTKLKFYKDLLTGKPKTKKSLKKDSNKGLRFSVLVFSICIIWFLLFYKSIDRSLIGGPTELILKPFYTKSRIEKCEYNTRIEKNPFINMTYADWMYGKASENSIISEQYKKIKFYIEVTKTRCFRIDDIFEFISKNNITKQKADEYIKHRTILTPSFKKAASVKLDVVGNFYLQKLYSTDSHGIWEGKIRLHYVLFIISILIIWRLRFALSNVVLKTFNKIKSNI
uniref:Uncharacterized protein n=1 Tax=uncultured marine microorganism HF4000_097M14 TaxID=455520 RepID=B3T1W5_9ZZZZ|nr:hypothetical protein ALOHA_HF4000097M14ctg1g17 [uncultured marine microorganism HF4000_097M14]